MYPLYELVRDLFQRISENSVKAKFAFWGFSEDEMRRPTPHTQYP